MKKFLKGLCLVLTIVMATAGLYGCGNENASSDSDKDTITVISVVTGDTGSRLLYEQAVEEFNNGKGKDSGIQIAYEAKESLGQSITVALQTKQAPDLFMAGSVAEYSEQGYITALDDLPGGRALIDKRADFLIDEKHSYKGKTYSIPYASNTYGLIYNKDMFKEAGLVDENGEATPPKTLKELREYARKLTNARDGKYGFVIPMKWDGMFGTDIFNMALASSGSMGSDYVTGKYDYSGFKDVLDTIMGMKEDKSIMPGAEGLDNDPARSRFAEGRIGMKLGVSWDVGVLNNQFPAKCDWGVAPLPTAREDVRYYQALQVNTGFKISSEAVSKIGAEKLMIAYEWLVSEELAKRIFELGANLPLDEGVLEGANTENAPKGWAEFADLIKISKPVPPPLPNDISGETAFDTDFINNVWPGNKTVEQAISDANRIYNAGVEKYFSLHSDKNLNDYLIPNYDRQRK